MNVPTKDDLPNVRPQSDYLYERRGPWPQPQPAHPFGFAPGVVHVPEDEIRKWNRTTGLRYFLTILTYWPTAAWYAWTHRSLEPLSDDQYEKYLTHSSLSKFVSNELNLRNSDNPLYRDNEKVKIFSEFLKKEPDEKWWVSDFTLVKQMKTYPGIYVAPTIALFKGELVNGQRKAAAIYFPNNQLMLRPEDGEAWELAKYFVMQGASLRISLSAHANLHFPYDSINAISKSALPKDGLLLRLLLPHLELSLELNYNVLNSKTSPVQNPHNMPYAALPSGPDGLATLFLFGYHGMQGNPSYPKYRFEAIPDSRYYPSDYGKFLMAYYETILRFVNEVVGQMPPDEYVDVQVWTDYIRTWVPEFPGHNEFFTNGQTLIKKNVDLPKIKEVYVLAETIANIIWDLSVGHAADHYDYSTININHMPFCIRVPPPESKNIPPIDRKKMIRWADIFKHKYERQMFFIARNVTLLKDLRYNFYKPGEEALRKLNDDFLKNLRETENQLPVYNYIPLDQIARSIQY
ncbi:MAG: hypothetical protein IPJ82_05035 [Lewinellaceae bacterium]|nr:hypothetical protein [Lewinellaceae bacterium]